MSPNPNKTISRIVVKIGSSLITNNGLGLNIPALENWSTQIAQVKAQKKDVILVSSGAIAQGCQKLGWGKRPKMLHELQAAAAVGQMELIHAYEIAFCAHRLHTAQVLLTRDDLADRTRYLNARSTLQTLLAHHVVPIINENDTVATNEIRFGDNDTLSALVANLVEADLLIILTDQAGLFTSDPRQTTNAELVREGKAGDPSLELMAGKKAGSVGTGGMYTKIIAAKRAALSGANTIIASGHEKNVLIRLVNGEAIGTQLVANTNRLAARKRWLADRLALSGRLVLDSGAVTAIQTQKKSLLPVGILSVEGSFQRGELVACVNEAKQEIARGLVNYNADETRLIISHPTKKIKNTVHMIEPEIIHRDNMVVL